MSRVSEQQKQLSQFFTPQWVANAVVEKYFGDLGANDLVLEPSCGSGAFLAAIPAHVPAVGVEIDPSLIPQAQAVTGREIVCGDFRNVDLQVSPTAMVGNPPFRLEVFMGMMDRAHVLLPEGAKAGFILPAYMLQTPGKVDRFAKHWSMTVELLPKTIWPRLKHPLIFCMFRKGADRALVGLALYSEMRDMESMRSEYRELLAQVSRNVWATALVEVLANLGGTADLDTIYRAMEPKRPTGNRWWKEKIRQVAQKPPFQRVHQGRYSLAALKAA